MNEMTRSSWLRRYLPPIALFGGLALFAVSMFSLAAAYIGGASETLHASHLGVANGTGVLVYPTPYCGCGNSQIDVSFAFPSTPGDAYFVDCSEVPPMEAGANASDPILSFTGIKEHSFVVSRQTLGESLFDRHYRTSSCYDTALVFRWPAPSGGASANAPDVSAVYRSSGLNGPGALAILVASVGSALLVLLGGLAWARAGPVAPPEREAGTIEVLRASLDRLGEQLERTRRHLLFAGVLGVFLWYPFLVPWSWQAAAAASTDAWVPWAVASGALVFLVALTLLWAREFVRLDRELRAWRARMEHLRAREAGLMESLEGG